MILPWRKPELQECPREVASTVLISLSLGRIAWREKGPEFWCKTSLGLESHSITYGFQFSRLKMKLLISASLLFLFLKCAAFVC